MTLANIVTVSPVNISENTLITIPSSGAVSIPASPPYRAIQLQINLSTADKLSTGKTLILSIFLSQTNTNTGGAFFSSIDWTSYGPGGHTATLPDGTVVVNPDPTIDVPLIPFAGHFAYLTYITQGITNAGATVSGIS